MLDGEVLDGEGLTRDRGLLCRPRAQIPEWRCGVCGSSSVAHTGRGCSMGEVTGIGVARWCMQFDTDHGICVTPEGGEYLWRVNTDRGSRLEGRAPTRQQAFDCGIDAILDYLIDRALPEGRGGNDD